MDATDREQFIEQAIALFHQLFESGRKADVIFLFGRREAATGEVQVPRVRVQYHGFG